MYLSHKDSHQHLLFCYSRDIKEKIYSENVKDRNSPCNFLTHLSFSPIKVNIDLTYDCTLAKSPKTYIKTKSQTFIAAPLGSIPDIPALSCHEIKASEGKDTISGKYWLDPTGTGKAVLIYCDMIKEGKRQSVNK